MGMVSEKIRRAVNAVNEHLIKKDPRPEVGAVLGSGLGSFAKEALGDARALRYGSIRGWQVSKVPGHEGHLHYGTVSGARGDTPTLIMAGRVHGYEGWTPEQVALPVRTMIACGVNTVILTNAAGGLNPAFSSGDLMVISDQLNLTGTSPLIGPNDGDLGPRFVGMTSAYDPALVELARERMEALGQTPRSGVYASVLGPRYETPAEARMIRGFGADAVGMSTVWECEAAVHMGAKVIGISCITNKVAMEVGQPPPTHEEVKEAAARVEDNFKELLGEIICSLPQSCPEAKNRCVLCRIVHFCNGPPIAIEGLFLWYNMSMAIQITKLDGSQQVFSEKKVRSSISRIGANQKTVDVVVAAVKKKLRAGMSTQDLHKIVRSELRRRNPVAGARYNLRSAIIRLGPAGFNFEKYIASLFSAYGYKTVVPDTYRGACVTHEVDVTAEKGGKRAFIEAKFRHDFSDTIGIKDTMSTWARFLDLVDGSKTYKSTPHFDEVWLVTNARFSGQSRGFGACKNMKLIGWKHPKERPLSAMVNMEALYPITIWHDLTARELEQFARARIMLCSEVAGKSVEKLKHKTGLSKKRLGKIVQRCEGVVAVG